MDASRTAIFSRSPDPRYMKDFCAFAINIAAGNLSSLTYVKALGYHTKHPGYGTRLPRDDGALVDRAFCQTRVPWNMGQLLVRDAVVADIGSLLDPATTSLATL